MPDKLDQHDIKDLRKRAKMSRQQMADYLGVTQMTVGRWEKAESRPGQLATRQLRRLHKKIGGVSKWKS